MLSIRKCKCNIWIGWPTWNEFLPFLVNVVAHAVVSTREDDGLFVEETEIVSHSCPQTEDVFRLDDNSSHLLIESRCTSLEYKQGKVFIVVNTQNTLFLTFWLAIVNLLVVVHNQARLTFSQLCFEL